MSQVTFIAFDGSKMLIYAAAGLSLMENAVANGIDGIEAQCGGNAYCGTCRVIPVGEWAVRLGTRGDVEEGLLSSLDEGNALVRLSCQITVSEALDGLVVRLPESQS
ncbi:2Fe-2S iron-sulfur cluster-binding protein [Novosphingobium sp.]|uniref:2Fe-2S iron-sulfur cluster-binding protein n=1 Tax=Novosphingobium sp. TaxID=1874826 RepID=UPI00286DE8B4|nr:2Fe-2S iron-sulfur cluster-binding protein [Novosphingobium sp.]